MSRQDPFALIGTTIADKYYVENVVDEGGFSVVYRATHLVWMRPVAIKAFRATHYMSADARERLIARFVQEGALLGALSEKCSAICQARDVGTVTNGRGEWIPYMVLEWLQGESLEVTLAREREAAVVPRSLAQAVRLLDPIAMALAVAHENGVAHRDVKPGNVIVLGDARDESCAMKLLDFGIATVATSEGAPRSGTRIEERTFTPCYGAPEQFSLAFGPTGPATDVFALALLVVELMAGREALSGPDVAELARQAMNPFSRPTPRAMCVDVNEAVEAVFLRALAVEPLARYASVGEFWNALRAAIALAPMTASLNSNPASVRAPSARASRPSHRRAGIAHPATSGRGGIVAAVTVGLAALGAGGASIAGVGDRRATRAESFSSGAAAALAPPVALPPSSPQCPGGMVVVAGGNFFMGSDDQLPMERPAHHVVLSPYCIDELEVTVADYKACSDRGDCKRGARANEWPDITAKDLAAFDPLCNLREPHDRASHPVNCVDWSMAQTFCAARSARLPTEAEWEFAARGSDGRKYPWGDETPGPTLLNACGKECLAWGKDTGMDVHALFDADDGWAATAPVGSFPRGASPFGLQDMVGNVWEWVSDTFAGYTAADQRDPRGPDEGDGRVIRGGAWNGGYESWVRPTFRYHAPATNRSYGIGFRCAKPLGG